MEPRVLVKGQNVALDPETKGLRMSVRWASRGDAVDVDLVALIIGEDRRVRSDADMIFYNQPGTGDGSVVHAGKVLGDGHGTDDVSVDIALLADDVTGLTVAASTDGAPFSEIDELQWCVFLENGEATVIYTVDGLTTERALASARGVVPPGWILAASGGGPRMGRRPRRPRHRLWGLN